MNMRDQILLLFHRNRQIIVAPRHDLMSTRARDLASVDHLIELKKDRLKNRGSPI